MNIQSNSKNVDTDGTNAAEPERKEPAEKEETADEADFVSGVSEVSEEEPRQEGKIKKKKKRGSEAMAWIRDIVAAVLIAVIIAQFILTVRYTETVKFSTIRISKTATPTAGSTRLPYRKENCS